VLWATHLIDEIKPDDRVVVMDKGVVKASGPLDAVIAEAGAASIDDAFARLTSPVPGKASLTLA
jgi:ABC-2 type transport system ATP-binding protein